MKMSFFDKMFGARTEYNTGKEAYEAIAKAVHKGSIDIAVAIYTKNESKLSAYLNEAVKQEETKQREMEKNLSILKVLYQIARTKGDCKGMANVMNARYELCDDQWNNVRAIGGLERVMDTMIDVDLEQIERDSQKLIDESDKR
jgi:hypothetical protein